MTRLARVVFALLVAATFSAFFVAQRLKHDPSPVQQYTATPVFSPNHDGRKDAQHINFKLRRADEVTVEVIDTRGDVVQRLAEDRSLPAYRQTGFTWDGIAENGRLAPDGRYRIRITLRKEGRSLVIPGSFVKDTVPPVVRVTSIGPKPKSPRPLPMLLPDPEQSGARVSFQAPPRTRHATVFRTSPGPVTRVRGPVDVGAAARNWTWDGHGDDGRTVTPGTYVVVIDARDVAGNIGSSVPVDRRTGLPRAGYGVTWPGRGGVTVRRLAVLPPLVPTAANALGPVAVDSRGRAFSWDLRRMGAAHPARRGVRHRAFLNHLHAPGGTSTVFLLRIKAGPAVQTVPYPVQSADVVAGRDAQHPHGVLVVLPAITWQGRNPIDDDGDGLPNVLDRGLPVRLQRVFAGDGLPQGFRQNEAPLLKYLDRKHHRYDITTDVALTGATGPDLRRYRGVILAGDARWLPTGVARELRAFAKGGGTVVSMGTDALRRQVRLTARGRLIDPTPAAPTDLFGARLGPLVRGNAGTIENIEDKIGLFQGGTGSFSGYDRYEPTLSVGRDARQVAAAVDGRSRPVIVAVRFGDGLVVRLGLPGFATHLNRDRNAAALMERLWQRLSR